MSRTLYAGGYLSAATIDRFEPLQEMLRARGFARPAHTLRAKAGDRRIKLSDKEQLWRQKKCVQREANVDKRLPRFGVKGVCLATELLRYTSYNNLFVVPSYHMLTHGVLKRCWLEFLAGSNSMITSTEKRTMHSRAPGIKITNDQTKTYSCITKNMANWKIHEWISWADVYSVFILHDITIDGQVPTPAQAPKLPYTGYLAATTFDALVHRLHSAVVFFTRP